MCEYVLDKFRSVLSQVYAQKFGSITGFKFMSDMFLLSLANKVCLSYHHHH